MNVDDVNPSSTRAEEHYKRWRRVNTLLLLVGYVALVASAVIADVTRSDTWGWVAVMCATFTLVVAVMDVIYSTWYLRTTSSRGGDEPPEVSAP